MKPFILLFGGSGQVGTSLRRLGGESVFAPDRAACDIRDPEQIRRLFATTGSDIVINAAALSAVDALEETPDEARRVNFDAVALIAAHCGARDLPFIHLSTDYVFDGLKGTPYTPDDRMNPVNVYGESKMMAEEALRQAFPWHVIVRTSSVFGAQGTTFLSRLVANLRTAQAQGSVARFVDDQIACPTPVDALAKALLAIAAFVHEGRGNAFGTFHFCGMPPCTRYAFAHAVCEVLAELGEPVPSLAPATSRDFVTPARRPPQSVLDCTRTREVFGLEQPDWRESLAEVVREIRMQH